MRKLTLLSIALGLLFAVLLPSAASAQDNAAEDEYTEGVPGGGGETPSDESPGGSGLSGSDAPLPPGVIPQFEAAGSDGAAAAELAQRLGGGSGSSDEGARAGGGSSQPSEGGSDGGFAGAVKEILSPESDSGMGIWLPIILGLTLLAALVAGIARMRNPRTPA